VETDGVKYVASKNFFMCIQTQKAKRPKSHAPKKRKAMDETAAFRSALARFWAEAQKHDEDDPKVNEKRSNLLAQTVQLHRAMLDPKTGTKPWTLAQALEWLTGAMLSINENKKAKPATKRLFFPEQAVAWLTWVFERMRDEPNEYAFLLLFSEEQHTRGEYDRALQMYSDQFETNKADVKTKFGMFLKALAAAGSQPQDEQWIHEYFLVCYDYGKPTLLRRMDAQRGEPFLKTNAALDRKTKTLLRHAVTHLPFFVMPYVLWKKDLEQKEIDQKAEETKAKATQKTMNRVRDLCEAAAKDDADAVFRFVFADIVNTPFGQPGFTALHWAASRGVGVLPGKQQPRCVIDILVSSGCDIDKKARWNGRTALEMAIQNGFLAVFEKMASLGAKIDTTDELIVDLLASTDPEKQALRASLKQILLDRARVK
jgi:hypothetical protein